MIFADTDFFLALLKPKDWLKDGERFKGRCRAIWQSMRSILKGLMNLLAKRYNLDLDDERLLKSAIYIKNCNVNVFDAFHAVQCGGTIISSTLFSIGPELGESSLKKLTN